MMNFEQQLQNEMVCTYLKSVNGCDKDCQKCHRAFEDSEIIAAYETAIEAMKKQKRMLPIRENKFGIFKDLTRCPNCGAGFEAYYRHGGREYCAYCGQALDWSEEEE